MYEWQVLGEEEEEELELEAARSLEEDVRLLEERWLLMLLLLVVCLLCTWGALLLACGFVVLGLEGFLLGLLLDCHACFLLGRDLSRLSKTHLFSARSRASRAEASSKTRMRSASSCSRSFRRTLIS